MNKNNRINLYVAIIVIGIIIFTFFEDRDKAIEKARIDSENSNRNNIESKADDFEENNKKTISQIEKLLDDFLAGSQNWGLSRISFNEKLSEAVSILETIDKEALAYNIKDKTRELNKIIKELEDINNEKDENIKELTYKTEREIIDFLKKLKLLLEKIK